jgi:transposase
MKAAPVLNYKALYKKEKALREALEIRCAELKALNAALVTKCAACQSAFEDVELRYSEKVFELEQLKKVVYGSKHERFVPENAQCSQLTLDLAIETVTAAAVTETITKEITVNKPPKVKKPIIHPGRTALPAHLRRVIITMQPLYIPEGSVKIGEEITEELELTPAELFVNRYVRPRYKIPQSPTAQNTEIIIAPMPDRPLEKAIAGPTLLTQIVIDKYADHLPLYRQLQRFERNGVTISDSTIGGWITAVCNLLMPLYLALKLEIFKSDYIHADETTIRVMDKAKKGTTHRGYFWVYNNSPGRMVVFDYQKGRDAEAPAELLNNFKGYLQTDGYVVYDNYQDKEGITLLNCMAHARRKFFDAQKNDAGRSTYGLGQFQKLYDIERDCKEKKLTNEQIKEVRQQKAIPILEHMCIWMKEQYGQVLPKSPIGQALAYSIERWDRLKVYTTNGMLCIDNNPVENSIRPVAIGRKNYLFAGSHEGAERSAMIYSLMATCKMNGVNPFDWFKEVLIKLPKHPINKIKELLPTNFKPGQN